MNIHPDFADFIRALKENDVEFVIVGAFAVAFQGAPRYTGDLDVWLRPTRSNAQAVLRALRQFGFESLSLTEKDILSGKILQMGHPPLRIDLLTELSGVTAGQIWASRQKGPLGDLEVFFLGREILIANKRASARPKDRIDLSLLGEALKPRGRKRKR